jgi:quercetin dioxygenase-like cupin family protein
VIGRRIIIGILGAAAAGVIVFFSTRETVQPKASGYVLKADEGEILERGKDNTITVKVDPLTGSPSMAAGTQTIGTGGGIPLHLHEDEDEMLFVHKGGGTATVGEQQTSISEGDTVYVPHGTWHGVKTGDNGISILWVVTPPGLENFFREIGSPKGSAPKNLTPAQIDNIGRKHGTRFKPQ